jgi:hypothetical protein
LGLVLSHFISQFAPSDWYWAIFYLLLLTILQLPLDLFSFFLFDFIYLVGAFFNVVMPESRTIGEIV